MRTHTRAALTVVLALLSGRALHGDALDDYVQRRMKEFDLPGVAVAVVKNGEVVKIAGYGLADVERRIATRPDHVYKIGSVSKQFIATGIMLLAADGKLKIDDPLARFVPDVPATWRPITIRHLLTHTAGLVRESPAFDPSKSVPDLEMLKGAYQVPLLFAPGDKWAYSNTGYFALAAVITAASGKPWAQYLDERVFKPAAMAHTMPTDVSPAPANRALGYMGRNNTMPAPDWKALRPSGAFFSTLADLAAWDKRLYGETILTDAARREMWTAVRLNDGSTYPYGYGWHCEKVNGRRVVWHGGGLPGYASYFGRFLDEGVTIVVLANGNDADLIALGHGLADAYFSR
jgi:CubicO group peptidase (beta-lactamase class C family)